MTHTQWRFRRRVNDPGLSVARGATEAAVHPRFLLVSSTSGLAPSIQMLQRGTRTPSFATKPQIPSAPTQSAVLRHPCEQPEDANSTVIQLTADSRQWSPLAFHGALPGPDSPPHRTHRRNTLATHSMGHDSRTPSSDIRPCIMASHSCKRRPTDSGR